MNSVSGTSSSTPTLQFGGVTSGLNTASIISALLTDDTQQLTNLQTQASDLTAEKTAYQTLSTSLNDLLSKAQAFTMLSAASTHSATSAQPSQFTATATQSAVPGSYEITVDHLATATVATSTTALGTPVTDSSQAISSLKLPGTVSAGTVSVTVDGKILSVAVDPTASLDAFLSSVASAIQSNLAGESGATVTGAVTDNHIVFTVAGTSATHTVLFGAPGDTSNALGIFGLTGQNVSLDSGGGAITGTSALGVAQMSAKLMASGLAGIDSTTAATGTLTINGATIAYDTSVDSLNGILTKINSSTAGVVASVDRQNDRIVLTSKTAGAQPIVMSDTGPLLAAMGFQSGTTSGEVIGQNALIHVNGQAVTSATNQVTNAIDGVTINLLDQTTGPTTLTVAVDQSAVQQALSDFVTSYNSLADQLDKLTANDPKGTEGPLATDWSVQSLASNLRSLIFTPMAGATGSIRSLLDLGVSTGAVGAQPGTTNRLTLDTTKLANALTSDPTAVSRLLDSATGVLQPLVTSVKSWTDYGGAITSRESSIDDQVRYLTQLEADQQERIDNKRAALEAQFATMEATLSQLQTMQSALGSQVNAMSGSGSSSSTGSSSSSSGG